MPESRALSIELSGHQPPVFQIQSTSSTNFESLGGASMEACAPTVCRKLICKMPWLDTVAVAEPCGFKNSSE